MLCESCHQREANHHITEIINGEVMHRRDVCPECFLATSPDAPQEAIRLASALRDARCEYCGGQPSIGSSDLLAMVRADEKLKFKCIRCSIEHNRYLQEHLHEDGPALPEQEQLALHQKLYEEAHQYMKEWVSQ
jgi:protein-arginine kinase activator protein McsA